MILLFSGLLAYSQDCPSIYALKIIAQGLNDRLLAAMNRFIWLLNALLDLKCNPPQGVAPNFFDELRNLICFLALGVTSHSLRKTFGIIFFLITIFGLIKNRVLKEEENKQHPRFFLTILVLSGTFLIYIQILLNWCSS